MMNDIDCNYRIVLIQKQRYLWQGCNLLQKSWILPLY